MKKFLLEINHSGQVHLFKFVYKKLTEKGHTVIVITKSNPSIEYLLERSNIPYYIIGSKGDHITSKVLNQIIHDYNAYKLYRKYRFHIGVGTSVTNDHLSALTKMKSVHFSDDDPAILSYIRRFSYPFSDTIISPSAINYDRFASKVISYNGTHELAYLHPNYFKPRSSLLSEINIKPDEVYFVVRFVALKAFHDARHKGISLEQKGELIRFLARKGRVFITSENPIEKEFEQYRLPVDPEDIHSLLYYATMFVGDSQTMTSEAAILGTPAVKCNTFAGLLSVPNELEDKYQLCYAYHPDHFNSFMDHIGHLLEMDGLKSIWAEKRQKFLEEKIDVTAFIVWFLENYPESKELLDRNPDYHLNLK